MATSSIPDVLTMSHLRYGGAPEPERERVAAALRAQGRDTQALLLYEGRTAHPALQAAAAKALGEGRTFRLLTLRRLGVSVGDADLRACAGEAHRAGRALEARLAYVALGDLEAVRGLASQLPASLAPPPPPSPQPPPATSTR